MSVHPKVIAAILTKDLSSLLPMTIVVILVLVLEAIATTFRFESGQAWALVRLYLPYVSLAACSMLIVAVFQQDPAVSADHDWLTRPIAKFYFLLAKLAFLSTVILVPMIVAHFIANLVAGHSFMESLQEATVFESSWTILAIPFLMTIAILSRSFMQTLGVLLATLVVLLFFASLTSVITPSPESLNDDAISLGVSWIQAIALLLLQLAALWLVYRFQYQRSDSRRARTVVAGTTLLSLIVMTFPFYIAVWPIVFPILQSTVSDLDMSAAEALQLDSAYACYPASTIGEIDVENRERVASAKIIGAPYWDESHLKEAGAQGVTYSTLVTSRNVPVDWRVMPIKVTATYLPTGLNERRKSRPAHVPASAGYAPRNAISHFWLASEELINDPAARVQFDYRLALLAPTSYTLEIDNIRRHFPKLGYCSAKRDSAKNQVVVNCFKRGFQPTKISAELLNVPASRVDGGAPNLSPRWLDLFDGQHYEMVIESPTLVSRPQVLVTAFEAKAFVNKQRIDSGLLGGVACPRPDGRLLVQSQWNDTSAHHSSYVAVDQAVNLEVLNWGGCHCLGQGAKDIGSFSRGGGTAHFYDDLAPILAKGYRVIGITRRGFGVSSKPDFGYDIARLSEDIVQVLDTLKVDAPVLVGHSFAGDELTFLAVHHPNRFSGLVYLDAAYDRSQRNAKERALLGALPPMPLPAPAELASRVALQPYLDRINSVGLPEGELMMSMDMSVGRRKYDERHAQAMLTGVVAPEYEKIIVPALAMYAIPSAAEKLMQPWYDQRDPRIRATVQQVYELRRNHQAAQIAQFKSRVANAEVVELTDADHSIFISNQNDVVQAIYKFLAALN